MAGYRLLDHTADVGVEAWGATPAEAFVQAARGLFAVVLDCDPDDWQGEGEAASLAVECEARSWPGLLVAWLSELLYRFDAEAFLPLGYALDECAPRRLMATLHGLTLADPAQATGTAVKAVTYHHLRVDVGNEEARIDVILDI
jgi:SHS2 domain-containing protein